MHTNLYIFLALWPITTATESAVYPHIVFLNPSITAPPKPISKAMQFCSVAGNKSDISNANYNGYSTQTPEIYSIGNFRWYVDHMSDEEVEILNKRDEISHILKDDPAFHISGQGQTNLPSWVSL
jgi:hypothetical protein